MERYAVLCNEHLTIFKWQYTQSNLHIQYKPYQNFQSLFNRNENPVIRFIQNLERNFKSQNNVKIKEQT